MMSDGRHRPPERTNQDSEADSVAGIDDRPIWLFDGYCGFCSWSVQFLLARERAPTTLFVAIQSEPGRDLARSYGVDPDTPSTFLFVENGQALEKSDGVVAVANHLRWPWRTLKLLRLLPKRWRDGLYDVVARNRYRILGRRDRCMMPPPHIRARFITPE